MKRYGTSLKNVIGWALIAAPILLLAGQPADRSATRPEAPTASALAVGGKEGVKRGPEANEDNWPEVESFMEAHSIHKLEAYKKLPPAAKVQVRAQLIARYNELNKLANKRLREIEVQRVEIEDDLFVTLLSERGRPHGPGDYSKDYLDAVRRLVLNRMDERAARVKEDEVIRNNPSALATHVQRQAAVIEKNGLGAAAPTSPRRRLPATSESEDEITPANR